MRIVTGIPFHLQEPPTAGSSEFTYLRGNVCLSREVHRNEEQLELAPRFYKNYEFVPPEKKGTSNGRRLISCGWFLLAGFAFLG